MDNSNSKITIPNPFAPTNEKNKKKFGTSVCRYILNSTKEYIKLRNAEFWKNRQYASGKQSLQPLLDLMEVDGKNTYANIRWKPNPIAKKFERVFSSTYMLEQHEHAKVTSLTKHIRDRKTNKKNEARVRMDNRELIAMLSEEAGMPIEDPNAFIPESEEELNIYFDLNDKEKEEVLMQDTLSFLINDIDFERLKMRHLQESFRVNLSGYYISNNPNTGRVDVEIIKGENCIYSPTERDDFGDITYAGRYVNMSVSAIRNRFEITDEKEFYEAIRKELGGKGMGNIRWEETYRGRAVRPYDSLVVPVTHVWWLTSKVKSYVSGKDNYGRTIFDVTDAVEDFDTYAKSGGRKIKSTLYPETAYEGFFLGDGQFCLEWGEQKNKFIYKGKILCPFVFHMAENEGSMLEPSPLNNILDEIEEMDLATLKIKQLIAKSAPEEYAIDISSLEKLDIGTGGELTPLDVMQIYRQTGDIYYSSESEDGVRNYQAPVQPTQSYIVQKMEAYVLSYNRALENIRDKLGINEFRDGSASNARTGYRFAQTQLQASNTATYVFYRGWLKTAEELVKRIGLITWNNAKYGTADNRFLNFIGKENTEFLKNIKDIVKAEYSFKYELTMTATEKQNLDDNIATALSTGLIEMSDDIDRKITR